MMPEKASFHLDVISDEEATCVSLQSSLFNTERVVTGSSKVHPKDLYNRDIGVALAAARAFRRMANELEELAELAGADHSTHVHVHTGTPYMPYSGVARRLYKPEGVQIHWAPPNPRQD